MNFKYLQFLSILFLLTSCALFSQTKDIGILEFVENKGQWHKNVNYRSDINNTSLFFEDNCITFDFAKESDVTHSHAHHGNKESHEEESHIINRHAYKMNFVNSNQNALIFPINATSDYCNYFIGNDKSKWKSNINKFKIIKYNNLYNNIDLKIYSNDINLKYDFIVNPSGNPSDIRISYEGINSINLSEDGDIVIELSFNNITEYRPYAYQTIDGKNVNVVCNYEFDKNAVIFNFPNGYDKNYPLIIDPSVSFCTYTGSTTDNWGFTATYDARENAYSGGIVLNSGYPASTGAYQDSSGGNWDVGIIKYNPTGTNRLYATYLGGVSVEMPHSLIVNEFDELLIFGTTGSNNFPTSTTAYDTTFNGGTPITYDNVLIFPLGLDVYVSKLSSDGTQLLASTYIGGSKNDGLNFRSNIAADPYNDLTMVGNDSLYYNYADGARGEINVDDLNNIYIGTSTFSDDFPVVSAFQPTNNGRQDGVVFKLDYNLSSLIWSTYLGGSEDDAIYSVDVDSKYDLYVAGGTCSDNFPTSPSAIYPNYIGAVDGFVSRIKKDGSQLMASTFYGSDRYDQAYFVRVDKYDKAYIYGQTEATGNTLIKNADYNIPNSGQFIAKMNIELDSLEWSTVFGTGNGKPNISPTAFETDVCNRIFISGWGREWAGHNGRTWASIEGTKGMQVTPDAAYNTTDGQDFYVLVMYDDADSINYATFFGEYHYPACNYSGHDHVDGGTSRFDSRGAVYQSMCASCGYCSGMPTQPSNVWSLTNNSQCNNAIFKISGFNTLKADFATPRSGCAPLTINFENLSNGKFNYWSFGDGTYSIDKNPTHTFTESGLYEIQLISTSSETCNTSDTVTKQFYVISNSTTNIDDINICHGGSEQIGIPPNGDPKITYSWTPTIGLSNPNISNPFASPQNTTLYTLAISNNSCTDFIKQNVIVHTLNINAGNDVTICQGDTLDAIITYDNPVNEFIWSDNLFFTNVLNQNIHVNSFNINKAGTYYVKAISDYCEAIDSIKVFISNISLSLPNDTLICLGDTINILANVSSTSAYNLSWSPLTGIVSGIGSENISVCPYNTITYSLVVENINHCTDSNAITINTKKIQLSLVEQKQPLCFGDCNGMARYKIDNAEYPTSYKWSSGITDSISNHLCADTIYTIIGIDKMGCSDTATFVTNQPNELITTVSSKDNSECNGIGLCDGEITTETTGGIRPYTYYWINNQVDSFAVNLCLGTYNLTVTDINNCTSSISVDISDPLYNYSADISGNNPKCFEYCDGDATVTVYDGTTPYVYLWSNSSANSTATSLCEGVHSVQVEDFNKCVLEEFIELVHPDDIIVNINILEQNKCYLDSIAVLQAIAYGGTPKFQYEWDKTFLPNDSLIRNIPEDSYTVLVTDKNGCTESNTIYVDAPSEIITALDPDNTLCAESCNGQILALPSGGTIPYRYSWSDGKTNYINDNLCEGRYYVTVTDANECKDTADAYVYNQNYKPYIDATADKYEIYYGESTYLHALTMNQCVYLWSPNYAISSVSSQNPLVNPDIDKKYYVAITDEYGCHNNDSLNIKVNKGFCVDPYIFVPNAFTPDNNKKNDILYVRGNFIWELYFAIYNRWGELVFETTDQSKGWDGTFKGEPVEPDVFVYYIKAKCGPIEQYFSKGNITVIR